MPDIPIDWLTVDWLYVAVLAVFVFLSTIIGNLISLNRRLTGAILSAVLFAVAFVFWTYYPHHLPLPTRLAGDKAPRSLPRRPCPRRRCARATRLPTSRRRKTRSPT